MSSRLGHYDIPKEYKDEDKWFRFFTKTQLLFIFAGGLLAAGIIALFTLIHLTLVGVIIGIVAVIIAAVLAFVPMPPDRYMIGGGYMLRTIVFRVFLKHLRKNKKLYVKSNNDDLI